ncbi:MAG TPA: T9SS type A sorting domain-containing protein, partial [Candidatus Sabulitectum sp.]|nr:T9SS type A sorting domain-containing protein [Candidatus Sabulitectum sp.]
VRNPAFCSLELTVFLESAASGWAEVFSLDGRLVVSAPLGELPPGRSTVAIPGELAPGVYLLRFNAGNSVSVLRATVLR